MNLLFHKLNLKDQSAILVINSPESFEREMKGLKGVTVIRDVHDVKQAEFILAFVTTQKEVDSLSKSIARIAIGDAIVWFAYPKGASKKYKCDFNRDTGWNSMGQAGFERVRQVAIDEDWSALRFRRVEFIKTMTRRKSFALTKAGKKKAGK